MTEPIDFDAGTINACSAGSPSQPQTMATDLRPSGVTAIGVLSGIGEVLAILSSGMFALQLVFGAVFASAMNPSGDAGGVQADYMALIQAVSNRFLIPNVAITITHRVLGVCVVVGAVKLLRRHPQAATFVRRIFLALIVFELLRLISNVMMQLPIYPVTQALMEKTAAGQGNGGAPPAMMKTIQQASMIIGIVFTVGWLTIRLAMVIWGRVYLNRQNVTDYLAGAESKTEAPNWSMT